MDWYKSCNQMKTYKSWWKQRQLKVVKIGTVYVVSLSLSGACRAESRAASCVLRQRVLSCPSLFFFPTMIPFSLPKSPSGVSCSRSIYTRISVKEFLFRPPLANDGISIHHGWMCLAYVMEGRSVRGKIGWKEVFHGPFVPRCPNQRLYGLRSVRGEELLIRRRWQGGAITLVI